MGSQSNLLILLGVIICVIAVYVGIQTFAGKTVEGARDEMRSELAFLSKDVVAHYHRPVNQGGGGRTFLRYNGTGRLKVRTKKRRPVSGTRLWETDNAVYVVIAASADSVVIEGKGDEIGNDKVNPIRLWGVVKASEFYTAAKN